MSSLVFKSGGGRFDDIINLERGNEYDNPNIHVIEKSGKNTLLSKQTVKQSWDLLAGSRSLGMNTYSYLRPPRPGIWDDFLRTMARILGFCYRQYNCRPNLINWILNLLTNPLVWLTGIVFLGAVLKNRA